MSTPHYPIAEEAQEKKIEAWQFVFNSLEDLEKRVNHLEVKLAHIRTETELGIK